MTVLGVNTKGLKRHVLNEICFFIGKQSFNSMNGYNVHEGFNDGGRYAAYGDVLLRLNGETYDDEDKGNELIRKWSKHYKNGYRTGAKHLDDSLKRENLLHMNYLYRKKTRCSSLFFY